MFLIQTLFFVLSSSKEGLPVQEPQSLEFSGTFGKPNGIKSSWEGGKGLEQEAVNPEH